MCWHGVMRSQARANGWALLALCACRAVHLEQKQDAFVIR